MKRDLQRLATEEFDVVVVGGGIFGVACAWEAITRGLSVALVEKGDFIQATSANCFKVIHGGIRYLQHADIPRVRSSVAERSTFLRIAPHLASPMPIVVPTWGSGKQGKLFLRTGMHVYDAITADRNRGIPDRDRQIPRHTSLSADEVTRDFAWLDDPELSGAVVFHDGQMYSPERLGLAFALSAAGEGACLANHVRATGFVRTDNVVRGVSVRDDIAGDDFEVRGRCVINAAGPWAERLLNQEQGLALDTPSTFSRDAWFLLRKPWVSANALAVQARTSDPDALLARAARHLFVVPWRDHTIVGVWHVVKNIDPDTVDVPDTDLQEFIDELNWACPELDVSLDDVAAWNAGLVLFGENQDGTENLKFGKRSRLVDHADDHGVDGLVTLIGVRYTTARAEAERALNLVQKKLAQSPKASVTRSRILAGGEIESIKAHERLVADYVDTHLAVGDLAQPDARERAARTARSLALNYGSRWRSVVGVRSAEHAITLLPDSHVTDAEIYYACREEMAVRLADVVMRRTELGAVAAPSSRCLEAVAEIMAAEHGWDAARVEAEKDHTCAELAHRRYRPVD